MTNSNSLEGMNFMDKSLKIRDAEIKLSLWDLGGHRSLMSMLPLVCNDAVVLCFVFDLSRISTLLSIKDWYDKVRGYNKVSLTLECFWCKMFLTLNVIKWISQLMSSLLALNTITSAHCQWKNRMRLISYQDDLLLPWMLHLSWHHHHIQSMCTNYSRYYSQKSSILKWMSLRCQTLESHWFFTNRICVDEHRKQF